MITWRRKKDGHVGLCHLRLDTGEGWRGGSGGGGTWLPGTELAAPPTLAITTERLPLLTTAPSALKANAVRPLCPRLLGDEPLSHALPCSWDLKCGSHACSSAGVWPTAPSLSPRWLLH